jgi:hypothetical protein
LNKPILIRFFTALAFGFAIYTDANSHEEHALPFDYDASIGNEQFLKTFKKAKNEVEGCIKVLWKITKYNRHQLSGVKASEKHIVRLHDFSSTAVEKTKEFFAYAPLRTITAGIRRQGDDQLNNAAENSAGEVRNFKIYLFHCMAGAAVVLLLLF